MNPVFEYLGLSLEDVQHLQNLNSCQHGLIKVDAPENLIVVNLVRKAVKLLQDIICERNKYKSSKIVLKNENLKSQNKRDLTEQKICYYEVNKETKDDRVDKGEINIKSGFAIHPKTYCTLGHYHLLLYEFEKVYLDKYVLQEDVDRCPVKTLKTFSSTIV